MSSNWQRFFNSIATDWAILRSVLRCDSDDCFTVHFPKVLQPLSKLIPSCVTNWFGKVVLNHILHLKLDLGYKIARFYRAQRRLYGEVLEFPRSRSRMGCLLTLKCFLPNLLIAFLRLLEPFFFRETRFCNLFNAFSLLRRCRGLGTVLPSLSV